MRRCAFLTLDDPSGWLIDDDLAYDPLSALGWSVESVSWRASVDWSAYDAVVIRSPWDYTDDLDAFIAVLGVIEQSGTPLFNDLATVRWNMEKTYLRELAGRGVPIVPTVWRERLGPGELAGLFEELDAPEAVIKPVVGAGAVGAFRLGPRLEAEAEVEAEVEAYFADRALMLQPFVPSVTDEGEYSLMYFNGEYSHAILKTPKAGDYRVQEEWGSLIRRVEPDTTLLAAGAAVLRALATTPLYARVDLVRATGDRGYWLMELELIEPALYFRKDDGAAERFARALHERLGALIEPRA